MNVIVTGGAGFIGSNLVDALIARGDQVVVIDNLSTGKLANLDAAVARGVELFKLDIRDYDSIAPVFEEFKPELVFHLAAQVDVRVSVADPVLDSQINVGGTINVLQASRAAGVRRVINTSTGGGIYGNPDVIPTPEAPPIEPMAPYGQSKLSAEGYCGLYTRLHELPTVSLRYGNVYGPRQDVHGEAGVVAIFCGCLLEGRTPTVFGDGSQTRDWVDVADVVRANLLAADSDLTGPINVGTGRETSVLDLIEALQVVGAEFDLRLGDSTYAPARLGEVQRSCLDVRHAATELGFEATVGLTEGLRRILSGLV